MRGKAVVDFAGLGTELLKRNPAEKEEIIVQVEKADERSDLLIGGETL